MNFPCLCVDNFYDNPDEVKNFALAQDFYPATNGEYPGKRTKPIDIINPELFNKFCNKFFSLYYDFRLQRLDWHIDTYFQLIEPNLVEELNQGWIHVDYNSVVSGVIYFNSDAYYRSGTSIYDLKRDETFDYEQTAKHKFNLGETENIQEYTNALNINNSKFVESIVFQNKFNRLISFDGKNFHKVDSYNVGNEPRLTQVFFVNGLRVNNTPIERMNNNGFQ